MESFSQFNEDDENARNIEMDNYQNFDNSFVPNEFLVKISKLLLLFQNESYDSNDSLNSIADEISFIKGYIIFELIWIIIVLFVLMLSNSECNKPLRMWFQIYAGIEFAEIIYRACILFYLSQEQGRAISIKLKLGNFCLDR